MQKTVILNFANSTGRYLQMQQRLSVSLDKVGYKGDKLFYNHEVEIHKDCPYHKSEDPLLADKVVHYGFKAYAIWKAIDAGYENILWFDAAVYPTKSINQLIEYIEKNGYIFFDNIGFSIGDYTSDRCLEKFNMSRNEAFDAKMIMACVMGFNIHNSQAVEFIDKYYNAVKDGVSYNGAWHNHNGEVSSDMRVKGHRHDQSVASIIIKQMGLDIINAQDTYFAYASHKGILKIADTVCLWSEGI